MRTPFLLALVVTLSSMAAGVARAGAEFDFSFTVTFDAPATINDNSISQFGLIMNDPRIEEIVTLELVLHGLSHDAPADLDIFLIDPFVTLGQVPFAVMRDRGDQVQITDAELTFSSSDMNAISLPEGNNPLVSGSVYLPEDSRGFEAFSGISGGTDAWILLVIDDADSDVGSFDGFTLRGTAVPEPVTLSLLALGALFTLRRKRR